MQDLNCISNDTFSKVLDKLDLGFTLSKPFFKEHVAIEEAHEHSFDPLHLYGYNNDWSKASADTDSHDLHKSLAESQWETASV